MRRSGNLGYLLDDAILGDNAYNQREDITISWLMLTALDRMAPKPMPGKTYMLLPSQKISRAFKNCGGGNTDLGQDYRSCRCKLEEQMDCH